MSLIGDGFLTIFSFVFLISIVVVIHELGHYWAGRFCGVHAEAFSMGFGPTLFSWRDKRGTVWRVAALPLGGYVKFLGDAGAASEPDADKLAQLRAQMGEAADRCYHFKPIWQRAFITAAGPIANFILAITIFAALSLTLGNRELQPVVGAVVADSPADNAGIRVGDRVVAIDGREVRAFNDIMRIVISGGTSELAVDIERDGTLIPLQIVAARNTVEDEFGGTRRLPQLGIQAFSDPVVGGVEPGSPAALAGFEPGDRIASLDGLPVASFQQFSQLVVAADGVVPVEIERDGQAMTLTVSPRETPDGATNVSPAYARLGLVSGGRLIEYRRYNPIEAVGYGISQTGAVVSTTVDYVTNIITGRASPELLNGPLGIATAAGQVAQRSIEGHSSAFDAARALLVNLINLAGVLSVGLGLVNLLPIPILDGGHLVYYGYEAVARRPLSMQAQALGFRVGLVFVLGLMLVATWNDLNYLLGQIF
ncbi:RIP metalloprotease RseP [Maricaulis maris]|jgi:regulator of sigma E protease|uniref:Zinc metalloprotease n=1 Tax=Maricaulis maris (strain MCS10) TaxID=394221 RepID=Q0APV8_MARMM|nr:RIP metalloprotease RseP [Maricaulis maris]ABI65679.1 site-2 protease, Metallo peptidase, MEROPS family M50B [Maricaulis maris MCS10]